MKDEIKEILEDIKEHSNNKYINPLELIDAECKLLLDYITNLQEERNMFKNSFETMSKNYFEEKSRNEKAIKYIKNNCILSDEWKDLDFCNFIPTGIIEYKQLSKTKIKYLLNILQGEE